MSFYIYLTVAMLCQLHRDGGADGGTEHPLQHLDNLIPDLNHSFFIQKL